MAWFFLVQVIFLAACGESQTSIITPITSSSPPPSPEPTSTPFPLSEVDLESLVIQDGGLPVGWSGGQIRDSAPDIVLSDEQSQRIREYAKGMKLVASVDGEGEVTNQGRLNNLFIEVGQCIVIILRR